MTSDAPTGAHPGARKAATVFIFVTVLIDIMAFGLIIPVLPHLVQEMAGGDMVTAAKWVGIFGVLFAAIQFVSSPVQGAMSDRFGRRPVILLSCLGLGVDFIFMALAQTLPWLLVGRVISAIFAASFTTANAYIADVTEPSKRAQAFGMLGAAFGLGFIVGPIIGGTLSGIDIRLPFWAAAGLALVNFCYGLFVLPESLPKARRSARIDWAHAHPFGSMKLLARYPAIWGMVAVVFLLNLAHYVYPSVFVLFADAAYGWGPRTVGYVLGVVGVLSVIVNAVLVKRVVAKFGERRALLIGLSCGVVGFAIYGLAPTGAVFLMGMPIMALWALAMPATQSMVTRLVGPEVQGRVQGALTSLASLAGIIAPAIYTSVFALFIGPHAPAKLPGAPFLLACALLASAGLVAWRFIRTHAELQVDGPLPAPANPGEG
ncbi:tetracycline resistance MFS efflux pump [Lysobacter helvus]|uniref:Tetracycline resistance MFS efflux pump n=2 Tax=Lysobacteraceae TaxID=32033 RepID=A0ABN6FRL0_9GAMM|nr:MULTISPECIES: TCR/Tet family MFS transporter [Lysobacter]BCT92284.1 tetracycline resistance MFS efflux pump [Lysobacter caseinilyticus]BCT95437.1 tetracycline resistance MFS efflux pump [Lysobacter helvus]